MGQPLIKDSSNTLVVIQLVLIFTLGYMIGHSKARSFINQISSDEVMELFGCLGKIYKLVKGMIYIVLPGIIPTYWILLVAAAFYSPDYLLTRPMFIQKTIISIVMLAILFIIAYITYKVMMKAIKNNADAIYNKRSQKNKIIDLKKREKELAQQNKRSRNHYYDY